MREELTAIYQHGVDGTPVVWPALDGRIKLGEDALDLQAADAGDMFTRFEVPSSAVTVLRTLGEGEFGLVQLGELDVASVHNEAVLFWVRLQQQQARVEAGSGRIRVAVKMTKDGLRRNEREQFEAEAKLLCAFSHPCIVKVVAVCFDAQPSFIALELMSGDLLQYLESHEEELRRDMQACMHMHECVMM